MTTMHTATTTHAQPVLPSEAPQPRRVNWPKPIWFVIVLGRFLRGYVTFLRTGRTPLNAYADMRRLFRMTNGRFNALASRIIGLRCPAQRCASNGILRATTSDINFVVVPALRRDGLYRFETQLDRALCKRLRDFARSTPCHLEPVPDVGPAITIYDASNPRATRYAIDPQHLHAHPDVQQLMLDSSILAMARGYLRCEPVLIGCTMWWSTAWKPGPCDAAAQRYHFDMSQLSFVKLFIYLTDVDQHHGPHKYILGSHHRKPGALLGDRRYDDAEILPHFDAQREVCLTGSAGAIFAENTSGFHKGMPLATGHRLILELLFASSGFGEQHEPVALTKAFAPEFRAAVHHSPRLYQRFRAGHGATRDAV